jgi:hypothetical protein
MDALLLYITCSNNKIIKNQYQPFHPFTSSNIEQLIKITQFTKETIIYPDIININYFQLNTINKIPQIIVSCYTKHSVTWITHKIPIKITWSDFITLAKLSSNRSIKSHRFDFEHINEICYKSTDNIYKYNDYLKKINKK